MRGDTWESLAAAWNASIDARTVTRRWPPLDPAEYPGTDERWRTGGDSSGETREQEQEREDARWLRNVATRADLPGREAITVGWLLR